MDAFTHPPVPVNEPNLTYAPGSPERAALELELKRQEDQQVDLTATIGGRKKMGGGVEVPVVQPHDHGHVLGVLKNSSQADTRAAIAAAQEAAPGWRALPQDERAAVLLKAADLLAGPWRQRINAATMLGQSKTAFQAEIDSACELIDFWRFNVHYAHEILAQQPIANSRGVWNRSDHRPLEGFVYAVTPFNFTAIAGNLPTAPALMGNTVLWKPSPTQQLAAHLTMELLEEAGMPPGVINLLPGDGLDVSKVALNHPDLAGIHFTGSTPTFQHLWSEVGANIGRYRSYPRIVGETGGKDFIVAHPSADPEVLKVAMLRGAFEFQGQKCSAASRAYVSRSVWKKIKADFISQVESIPMGDVTDFSNFMGPSSTTARSPSTRRRSPAPSAPRPSTSSPVARSTTPWGTSSGRPSWRAATRPTRCSTPSTSARSSRCTSSTTPTTRTSWTRWSRSRRTPSRVRSSRRTATRRVDQRAAAVRGRQLLRQRQADRCGRGAAALRRCAGLGHQRQGWCPAEPAALDVAPLDQGDVRPAEGLPLPLHGPRLSRGPAAGRQPASDG